MNSPHAHLTEDPEATAPSFSPDSEETQIHTADVAIVGYGPVGALLALLLAQKGHNVIAVDRWLEPYKLPRAVTFDHEIARILSMLGIDSDDDSAIERHPEVYYWKNAENKTLLEVDWGGEAASGWAVRYWFYQPELEARLRAMANAQEHAQLLSGVQIDTLDQDDDGVVIAGVQTLADGRHRKVEVRAQYVVGADGANSFVRQALGLEFADQGYFFDWLILDMVPHEERVWEPTHWQLCDPKRPTTIVPGGPGRRRWEFMVLPGEAPSQLASPESAWSLLEPWGLTQDNATLERSAVYRFQARCASQWRQGRGLIAGDAAHLMPPFAGEGMCAGVRDSVALAWRLDLILRGLAEDSLLDSYGVERRAHVQHYIDFSVNLGKIICIADPDEAAERDARMIAEMENYDGTPVNTDIGVLGGPGVWVEGDAHAGELAVQGVVEADGRRGRFDDVVGRGWILFGRSDDPSLHLTPDQLDLLGQLEARFVHLGAPGSNAEVVDAEGTFDRWLTGLGVEYVLVRPDFYVAATATDADHLRRSLDSVLESLHLSTATVAV